MRASALKPRASGFILRVGLLAVLTAVGLAAIVIGFIQGHEVSFNTSTGVPWGILISSYLFFVLPASGLCLLSALGHVGGVERFKPLGRRAVLLAIALLLAGFLVIASDLERPWLIALYIVLTPNPTSPMWWMGSLYAIYFGVLLVEFFFLERSEAISRLQDAPPGTAPLLYRLLAVGARPDLNRALRRSHGVSRVVGTLAAVLAVAALSTLGAVFGFTGSRSLWYGPLIPVYFILSALLGGSAVLCLAGMLSVGEDGATPGRARQAAASLGRPLLILLGAFFLFTLLNLLTAQYGLIPEEYQSVMVLVRGPLAAPFWAGEIVIGLLAPMAILAVTGARKGWALSAASILVIVGMFFARYNFVLAGQLVPVIGREGLWEYGPAAVEILTILGAGSLGLLLYMMGSRFLPLDTFPGAGFHLRDEATQQPAAADGVPTPQPLT